jgi:hypothetical protein
VRYRASRYLSAGSNQRTETSDIEALAKSRISAGGLAANCGYLLQREEGIDLRLSRAARPQGLAEKCRLPGQRSKPPRCWVSLDENLVLTSVSVFGASQGQTLILRKQYSASGSFIFGWALMMRAIK